MVDYSCWSALLFLLFALIVELGVIDLSLDKPPKTGSNRSKTDTQGQTKFRENPKVKVKLLQIS